MCFPFFVPNLFCIDLQLKSTRCDDSRVPFQTM
jgi:hypothetical protein